MFLTHVSHPEHRMKQQKLHTIYQTRTRMQQNGDLWETEEQETEKQRDRRDAAWFRASRMSEQENNE